MANLLDECISKAEHYSQTLCSGTHHTAPVDCGEVVICLDCGETIERLPREAAQLTLITQLYTEEWPNYVMEVRTS